MALRKIVEVIHCFSSLQEFGHRVRLATHANFCSFVRTAGVEFYPLGGDPRELAGCKKFSMNRFIYNLSISPFFLFLFTDE